MAQPREHLRNAPIVEAVIDFRVLREPNVQPSTFQDLTASIGKKYSHTESIHSFEAQFGFERGKMLDTAQRKVDLGWKYQAGTELAQFRVDGFTFSKIEPYTTWEEVFGEAERLWKVYLKLAMPNQLSRIAVRYINSMKIPGNRNINEILEFPPQLPLPNSPVVLDFLTRVHIADESRGSRAVVVQALEPQFDPGLLSILLDIDAYRLTDIAPTDPMLPSMFQQLRELKNEIFYASITEKTVEMYA